MSGFELSASLFGLEVSLKKTEFLHKPAPLEVYRPLLINIGEDELNSIKRFTTDWPGQSVLSKTVQGFVNQKVPKGGYQDQRVGSHHTDHSTVWF